MIHTYIFLECYKSYQQAIQLEHIYFTVHVHASVHFLNLSLYISLFATWTSVPCRSVFTLIYYKYSSYSLDKFVLVPGTIGTCCTSFFS